MTTYHHEHEEVAHGLKHSTNSGDCCVPGGDGSTCDHEGHTDHAGHEQHAATPITTWAALTRWQLAPRCTA